MPRHLVWEAVRVLDSHRGDQTEAVRFFRSPARLVAPIALTAIIALLLVRALGKRTLTLGRALTFSDLILAPFTPSNIARGNGTI